VLLTVEEAPGMEFVDAAGMEPVFTSIVVPGVTVASDVAGSSPTVAEAAADIARALLGSISTRFDGSWSILSAAVADAVRAVDAAIPDLVVTSLRSAKISLST
jgi:hypothetical protein